MIGYCALHLQSLTTTQNNTDLVFDNSLLYKMIFIAEETQDMRLLNQMVNQGLLRKCEVLNNNNTDRYDFLKWLD